MASRGSSDAPRGGMAIVAAIEAERADIRNWAKLELQRLDSAATILRDRDGSVATGTHSRTAPPRGRSKRRRAPVSNSKAAMLERSEGVRRFLVEAGQPMAMGEISRALKLTPSATTTALATLCKEDRAVRIGSGAATRYAAKDTGAAGPAASSGPTAPSGTIQGRILETIEDRGWASEDELMQALGAPRELVAQACGGLVRDEEIQMARREGRAVYVTQGGA